MRQRYRTSRCPMAKRIETRTRNKSQQAALLLNCSSAARNGAISLEDNIQLGDLKDSSSSSLSVKGLPAGVGGGRLKKANSRRDAD